ncbi:MAG TPA: hypothetical protein VMG35_29455 [Bryobacteraceae bacterium]|nr:hypothetical protein [Bryobacteraceae bacterium]
MLTNSAEPVNTYRYLSYLGSRWRFIAVSCAIAVSLALAVSLTRHKLYSATCRILVEPPAGTDLRASLSPVYLESLKTYEHFAASDSLFERALGQFKLRQQFPNAPIESLKSDILKVAMVRDTKILEIKVTLPDPKTAQALAQYLGEETVALNRMVNQEGNQDLMQVVEKQEAEARARLEATEAAWSSMLIREPIDQLEQEVSNDGILVSSLQRQLLRAELDASDPQQKDAAAAKARVQTLGGQVAEAQRRITAKEELLAHRVSERDRLSAERTARRTAFTAIQGRLTQLQGDMGYRSERLRIIDPAILPERPSSPNTPLHVMAALLLGLLVPAVYLALELNYQTQRARAAAAAAPATNAPRPLRATGTADD